MASHILGKLDIDCAAAMMAGTIIVASHILGKLDIDCAADMVGLDHHCGFSHPR